MTVNWGWSDSTWLKSGLIVASITIFVLDDDLGVAAGGALQGARAEVGRDGIERIEGVLILGQTIGV